MSRVDAFIDLLHGEASALTEASINRIFSHIKGGESFALITNFVMFTRSKEHVQYPCVKAWGAKHETELEHINRANLKKLKAEVESMGYGYIRVQGRYEMGDEAKTLVSEPSLFIIGITAKEAKKLGNKYCQESVLWGKAGEGTFLLFGNGSKDKISDNVSPTDFKYGWSEWKKRKFSFQPPKDVTEAALIYEVNSWGDNYKFMKSVDEILHKRYSASLVEQALDYIIEGGDVTAAVELMRSKKGD